MQLESITKKLERNSDIYDTVQGFRLNQIIPEVIENSSKQEDISLSTLYNCVVERLLYSSSKKESAIKMLSRDNDPQLFECLLSNSKDGLGDLLRLGDLIVKSDMESTTSCLRLLTLNMSRHMLEFSSRCLDNLIFFVEPSIDARGNSVKTLKYRFKDEYYRSCSEVEVINTAGRGNDNTTNPLDQIEQSDGSDENLRSLVVKVRNKYGVICDSFEIESMDDRSKSIGSLIKGTSEIGDTVRINGETMTWNSIKDKSFRYVQRLCGEDTPIRQLQFCK